jgi:glycosyltransferase involved in cell wall biosynthesis
VEVPEPLVPDSGGPGRRIGFLGRLHPKKQLEVLLGALAMLPAPVELVVAGSGEPGYRTALEERARSLGIHQRVRWLGYLGAEAKRQFFADVDVVACPSLDENFGIVVAEAMASGRAVVVAPGVALASLVASEGAGVVAPADPASFSSALAPLLVDGAARARLGAAGRRVASERWRWERAALRTLALYEEACTRRSAGVRLP